MTAVLRTSGGQPGRSLRSRVAALAILLLLGTGCVVPDHRSTTLEVEPLAVGWSGNLEKAEVSGLPQFRWSDSGISVEIRTWSHDPVYFMLFLRNDGDAPVVAHLRAADGTAAQAHAKFSVRAGGVLRAPAEDGVLRLSPGTEAHVWLEDMDWRDDPQVGDQLEYTIVFDSDRGVVRCPVAFRVARRRLE